MYQQQQVASQNNDALDAANKQRAQARQEELTRQDDIRRQRGEISDANLAATGAAGNAQTQADAEAARLASANTVPTSVGTDVPQIYTTPGALTGGIVTADVAKGLGEARDRLAARSRLAAYGDVGQEEKRMRSLSASAFDALSSMSKGSMGVYGSESSLKPNLETADTSAAQAGVLAGNYLMAKPQDVKNFITGETSNTTKLAEALNARLLSGTQPAGTPAQPYTT
jgi:hypothetical protein